MLDEIFYYLGGEPVEGTLATCTDVDGSQATSPDEVANLFGSHFEPRCNVAGCQQGGGI